MIRSTRRYTAYLLSEPVIRMMEMKKHDKTTNSLIFYQHCPDRILHRVEISFPSGRDLTPWSPLLKGEGRIPNSGDMKTSARTSGRMFFSLQRDTQFRVHPPKPRNAPLSFQERGSRGEVHAGKYYTINGTQIPFRTMLIFYHSFSRKSCESPVQTMYRRMRSVPNPFLDLFLWQLRKLRL